MIAGLPNDWRVTTTLDGAVIDTGVGRMLYVATSPLVRARELVRQRLAWRSAFQLETLERVITDEGEFAVIASALATDRSREIAWGIVFADERLAYYELEAPASSLPRAAEVVAIAARSHRFALGLRWRRYRYTIPDRWDALARGLVTDWYAPGYPSTWAVLTVYPALPAIGTTIGIVPSLVMNAKAHGLNVTSEQPYEPESAHGLEGVGTVIAGTLGQTPVKVQIAAFLDDRYVYAMELQSRSVSSWSEHQSIVVSTIASIEPLPRPRLDRSGSFAGQLE
jgi:hypothetical protein